MIILIKVRIIIIIIVIGSQIDQYKKTDRGHIDKFDHTDDQSD